MFEARDAARSSFYALSPSAAQIAPTSPGPDTSAWAISVNRRGECRPAPPPPPPPPSFVRTGVPGSVLDQCADRSLARLGVGARAVGFAPAASALRGHQSARREVRRRRRPRCHASLGDKKNAGSVRWDRGEGRFVNSRVARLIAEDHLARLIGGLGGSAEAGAVLSAGCVRHSEVIGYVARTNTAMGIE